MTLAGKGVGPFALDFDCGVRGRLLEDSAGEGCKRRFDLGRSDRAGVADRLGFSLGVVGFGDVPQMDIRDIGLGQLEGELGQPRRRLEEDRQHARGQRVECPRVTHAAGSG